MSFSGGVQAEIKVSPQKSQIFIAISAIASACSLLACFAFLWTGRERWEIPLYAAAAAGLVAFICWLISHRNSDLSGGAPTEIKISPEQLSVTIDPRADLNKNILQGVSDYINTIVSRQPLPISSGVVNADGTIVKDSGAAAEVEVNRLNQIAAAQLQQVIKLFGVQKKDSALSDQEFIEPPNYTGEEPLGK
ncbi:hypothetical protein [Pseudomonas grimontii]|uniref:hypothetical protein n=1 Tax=Pseudomonas grimontii TaxID=129847 RepID=UPI0021695F75|nr:hypothetical protein [Pseudomonas grimontii]MCS3512559.1 hypothetical protein [Pseudomonas grimontii]